MNYLFNLFQYEDKITSHNNRLLDKYHTSDILLLCAPDLFKTFHVNMLLLHQKRLFYLTRCSGRFEFLGVILIYSIVQNILIVEYFILLHGIYRLPIVFSTALVTFECDRWLFRFQPEKHLSKPLQKTTFKTYYLTNNKTFHSLEMLILAIFLNMQQFDCISHLKRE